MDMEDMTARSCTIALSDDHVIVCFGDDVSDGITLDMQWRGACQLGLRLIAASERAAQCEGVDGDLGRTLVRAMLDQVVAEMADEDVPVTWIVSPMAGRRHDT